MKIFYSIFLITIFCNAVSYASKTQILTIYKDSASIQKSDLVVTVNRIKKEMRKQNIPGEITILKSYPGQKEWKLALRFSDTEGTAKQTNGQQAAPRSAQPLSTDSTSESILNNTMNSLSNSLGADVYVTPKLHVH